MTSVPGIFSCGNALHVHDLVDWVSEEADRAGRAAAVYASGYESKPPYEIKTAPGKGVRYVTPDHIRADSPRRRGVQLAFRVLSPSRDGVVEILAGGVLIKEERHARLHPAEMIRTLLDAEDMARIVGERVQTLEVRIK
jgi:hypothetical protein